MTIHVLLLNTTACPRLIKSVPSYTFPPPSSRSSVSRVSNISVSPLAPLFTALPCPPGCRPTRPLAPIPDSPVSLLFFYQNSFFLCIIRFCIALASTSITPSWCAASTSISTPSPFINLLFSTINTVNLLNHQLLHCPFSLKSTIKPPRLLHSSRPPTAPRQSIDIRYRHITPSRCIPTAIVLINTITNNNHLFCAVLHHRQSQDGFSEHGRDTGAHRRPPPAVDSPVLGPNIGYIFHHRNSTPTCSVTSANSFRSLITTASRALHQYQIRKRAGQLRTAPTTAMSLLRQESFVLRNALKQYVYHHDLPLMCDELVDP